MSTNHRRLLREIRTFPSLIKYLRDELDWPITTEDFEELTFDHTPEELGIDAHNAAKIQEIKRLRPFVPNQPWGIFFVKFEPKRLPVVALRRILGRVVVKKRASANVSDRPSWELSDLLFISNYGESDERRISLAHFSQNPAKSDLPTLKVLGWDNLDTPLHLDDVAETLTTNLSWPDSDEDVDAWRKTWRSAFTIEHREVITTSRMLAVRLAELARAIRNRIRSALAIETEQGPIRRLMKAFQQALIHDLTDDDFADMYAQTIAYGLLSARVTNPTQDTADAMANQIPVTNPFLKELMETFLHLGGRKHDALNGDGIDFDELGVNEVVELLDTAKMEAVIRDFGDRNPEEDPVIHFYELFLKEYDARKRMQRGVFYTPRPVVSFIVRSIDELLRTKLGLNDGLADTSTWSTMVERHKGLEIPENTSPTQAFVQILDPAAGTGTFLVETIDVIHQTLIEKWKVAGKNSEEIEELWNDYVPKHLLPRLHGYELLMAPYAIAHMKIGLKLHETGYHFGSNERARVYLTNALEPASDFSEQFEFMIPALAHEAQAVNTIKQKQSFTVVIGNPPYSVSSQNAGEWITQLCEDFKLGLEGERNIQPLSDDYIKFLRFSLSLLEQSTLGIHGMVTNREYTQGIIHRALRKCLLDAFNLIVICDLHGQRGELLHDCSSDENVFEIEKGVAVSVLLFGGASFCDVRYGEVVGKRTEKAVLLLRSTSLSLATHKITPQAPFFFLRPWENPFLSEYQVMPSLLKWFSRRPVTGFATHRDGFAIDFCKSELEKRIQQFTDKYVSDETIRSEFGLHDTRDWHLVQARKRAQQDSNLVTRIVKCAYRPFDFRWVIYSDDILEYSRRSTMKHISPRSPALICSRIAKDEVFAHVFISAHPVEKIFLSPKSSNNAQVFVSQRQDDNFFTFDKENGALTLPAGRETDFTVPQEEILKYIYSVLHSPKYRTRYAESLKIDFPRLPLPGSLELFHDLAHRGGKLVNLHLMESSNLTHFPTTYYGPEDPKVGRVGWSSDTVWLDAAATNAREGHRATKPGTIGFCGVPEEIWNFHIGGYQVCHKWLKDRKGRTLSKDDIDHYQKIVVALNETIGIMQEIDSVIEKHGGWPDAFQVED